MEFNSSILTPENLNGIGKIQKVSLTNGNLEASLSDGKNTYPAVISNSYGAGKTIYLTFDLGSTAGNITQILKQAVEYTTPKCELAKDICEIEIKVNSNSDIKAKLKNILPEGTEILWAEPTLDNNNEWIFDAAKDTEYTFRLLIKTPENSNENMTLEMYYLVNSDYMKFDKQEICLGNIASSLPSAYAYTIPYLK